MNGNACINDGENLINEMESSNKNDYLTGKVKNELNEVLNEIKSLDADIAGVKSAVEAERQRLIDEAEKNKKVYVRKVNKPLDDKTKNRMMKKENRLIEELENQQPRLGF